MTVRPLRRVMSSPRITLARVLASSGRGVAATLAALVLVAPVLTFTLTVAAGELVGAVPGAVKRGFDSSEGHRLITALTVLGAAFVLQYATNGVREALACISARRVDRLLKARVLAATLGPSGVAHVEDPEILDKIAVTRADTNGVTPGVGAASIVQLVVNRLQAVPAIVLLAAFHWWMPVVCAVPLMVMRRVMRRHILESVQTRIEQAPMLRRSEYFVDLALTPAAAKEARIFGLRDWLGERYRSAFLDAMVVVWRNRARSRRRLLAPVLACAVSTVVGSVVIVRAALHGDIGLARLTILMNSLTGLRVILALGNEDVMVEQGAAVMPAILDVERLLHERRESMGGHIAADGRPRDAVRFEGVGFRYPGTTREIYRGLDLEIRAGESLAIVGVNGAGKTTLVKLLARLHDPTAGRITVDGVELRDIEPDGWQRRVAAIFQDFTRYELPARDNVGFGALDLANDDAELTRAVEQAGAASIIDALPNGWDTMLSRRFTDGVDLSGGQWQRVALARALLAVRANAGVLVLDEPTANLDVRAEAELYDRFLELARGVTTVVISHRFSTVRRADRIVVLDRGRVVEDGTHDELVVAGGEYARMFALQAARFADEVPSA